MLIATFVASLIYAGGSLKLKGALQGGVASREATGVTNLFMALLSLPLLFFIEGPFHGEGMALALLTGACLFFGRWMAILALKAGDLSLVGPLLSLKTLILAVFGLLSGTLELQHYHWWVILVGCFGVGLLHYRERKAKGGWKAMSFALLASVFFAGTDLLVVMARDEVGLGWLMPGVFLTLAMLTPLILRKLRAPPEARPQLYTGASMLGVQTTLVVLLIAWSGEAILINIIYSSRAIWTVVADRFFGKNSAVKSSYRFRLAGAMCIFVSVVTIVVMAAMDHYGGVTAEHILSGEDPNLSEAYPL